MLIVLGGFLGSGRHILARKLAERMGFYYYDSEGKKPRRGFIDKNHMLRERIIRPMNDEARTRYYELILDDFRVGSKMYPDIVVDDSLHRKKPRDFFLHEARKYFDKIAFVWVDTPEESVAEHFSKMNELKIIRSIEKASARRARHIKNFEQFGPETPVFFHHKTGKHSVGRLMRLVREGADARDPRWKNPINLRPGGQKEEVAG